MLPKLRSVTHMLPGTHIYVTRWPYLTLVLVVLSALLSYLPIVITVLVYILVCGKGNKN